MKVDIDGCVWYNQAEYVRKCIEKLEIENKLKEIKLTINNKSLNLVDTIKKINEIIGE